MSRNKSFTAARLRVTGGGGAVGPLEGEVIDGVGKCGRSQQCARVGIPDEAFTTFVRVDSFSKDLENKLNYLKLFNFKQISSFQ